ncbi:MAG: hypothetical protein Kow0029_01210 [Candidatus Rifleibacteriota bacterium]
MRQTNAGIRQCKGLIQRVLLCILLVFFAGGTILHADISNPTLTVSTGGADGAKINGSGQVTLTANWTGDTPPYSATFKAGTNTLGSDATSGTSSTYVVSGGVLGHGNKTFSVSIIETSVPGAVAVSASGDKSVEVDLVAPVLDAVITNGSVFANTQKVRIQITSDEMVKRPTVTCNGKTADLEGSATEGTSFVFNLQLDDTFINGSYNVSITAKDTSIPEAGANTGTTSVSFTVGSAVSGNTTIDSSSPASPTNATTITLSGTCPSGATNVELLDNGTAGPSVSVTGTSWSIGLSPAEGTHRFVAISKDVNGTEISRSAEFTVIIDRTAPTKPVVDSSSLPANTNQASVNVPVTIPNFDSETAKPVTIQPYVNGVADGSPQTVSASPTTVGVSLAMGLNRITFTVRDAAGNTSEVSDAITITRDASTSSSNTIVSLDSPVVMALPIASTYQLGAGAYKLKMIFEKEMDRATNPTTTITNPNGGVISTSAGSWTASNTFVADFTIPANGGTNYDGPVTMEISGAKDIYGNTLDTIKVPSDGSPVFTIDSTPPVSDFDTDTTIYISSSTPEVTLSGTVNDTGSGIEYVDLIWQDFTTGAVASRTIPVQASSPSPWSLNWNASSLTAGKYKVWVAAGDRAKPAANVEAYLTKPYRIAIVDRDEPSVTRISIGNVAVDINMMNGGQPPVIASAVTRLVAKIADNGGSGIDFSSPSFEFKLQHDATANQILGNYTNNGSDTIYFDFPELTINGTYTVSVTPVDMGGNIGASQTRQFVIDNDAPSDVVFYPANHSIANETHIALAQDQVWATINDPMADYSSSTIQVRYNGNIIGEQIVNGSTTALVWDIGGPSQTLPKDQSGDGRYDITVVPKDTLGNVGAAQMSYFYYDCVPPVITSFTPAVVLKNASATWFGLDQSELSITVSDAPKDIITYKDNMDTGQPASGFDFSTVQIPGDPNWYNGQGSGVDMQNSSFTYQIAGVNSPEATVIGNKLYQARPALPADTAPGVVDVSVSVIIKDHANDGQVVPNTSQASYTLKFDYLVPNMPKITKPEASNNKYCKNSLPIEGSARDQGTSNEVMISGIETSDDGVTFTKMTVTGLPAASATFSTSKDITSYPDGTYTIYVRAVDLGNNRSEAAQATYVVDRTPPNPPEMTIPLPDTITNKRGQLFKWAATTDADHYLLQIADDPSFNNILNKQTNTGYPELVGQVTVMTENSFSVPKDGTYYWRVAAIETCADGYNISSFSTTRRFTVDTVKPLVVEVQPAPSSGNKITTGMVTFTIRFSELIDTTIPPTVKLTTNGGQVMTIELVSYQEDTWTGTTVIPKNNSALYDGTAIISIENARDLAGNVMAVDSTNTVVINTGPAFTTKIFSNPANEFEIMIVTKASEALQSAPTVTVQQSSTRTPVIMNFLKERYYAGSYKIDVNSPGKAYIDIAGTDLHGMNGYDSVQFVVAELSASKRLDITSISGKANLKAAEGSAYTPSSIYLLDRESLESPFTNEIRASVMPQTVAQSSSNELVPIMPLDEIGPSKLTLKKCLLYTADVKGLKTKLPIEKIGLYRQGSNGKWIYQGGEVKDSKISAQITGLGRMALMADLTAPSIEDQSPANMAELENPMPTISGKLVDLGSGIKKESFKLRIDNMEIPDAYINPDGSFKYKVRLPMKKGRHEIVVTATDKAGNELRNSFWITTLGQFAIDEFMPYPNPVTGNSMYFNYNFNQTAERVVLKIYDTAGHKVAQHDTFDFANARQGRFRWDLRNDSGRIIANGVYFYKLEITKNGKTFKKRGKFAVMR